MPLTPDEPFDVFGDLCKSIAQKLREGDVANQIDRKELYALIQQLVVDAVKEITD